MPLSTTHAPSADYRLLALPIVLIAIGVEGWLLWRRRGQSLDWRASLCSAGVAMGHHLGTALGGGVVLTGLGLVWRHRLATIPLDSAWSWVALFVLSEFSYYVYHRASHEVRWLWATHSVHHSPEQLNLSAAYRLGWTSLLGGAAFFFVPLVWIGYRPEAVLGIVGLNLLYQFWLHTELVPPLGFIERILNTPAHHRVHHASNAEYLDRNYGGVLIVFDRWFGTHAQATPDNPCRYGLVHPVRSNNPFVVAFAEWRRLFYDVVASRTLKNAIGHLIRRPGWRPESSQQ